MPLIGDARRALGRADRSRGTADATVHGRAQFEGGVSAADVAAAHEADLAKQGPHGVIYLRYWVDEEALASDIER